MRTSSKIYWSGENSMKKNINIAGFKKAKSVHYSTSVTATKGEKIAVFLTTAAVFATIVASIIIGKILMFVLSIVFGILLIFGIMIFCVFRPVHKKERIANSKKVKIKTDYSYNNITGKVKDNSHIEIIKNDFSEVIDMDTEYDQIKKDNN